MSALNLYAGCIRCVRAGSKAFVITVRWGEIQNRLVVLDERVPCLPRFDELIFSL
jgi:hypothetical protein